MKSFPHLANLLKQHLIIAQMTIRLYIAFAAPRKSLIVPRRFDFYKFGYHKVELTKKI